MDEDLIQQTFGRISLAADGPPWLVDGHKRLLKAVGEVTDGKAREVLTDLIGMVGVLERRTILIDLGTVGFRSSVDTAFQELVDKYAGPAAEAVDPLQKVAAVLSATETLARRAGELAASQREGEEPGGDA